MMILLMMIPMALLLGGAFVAAFLWAARDGQFDDAITPAYRVLNDEKERKT